MMPKVSVIIPAYNAEKKIAETLDSVLRQTFSDFEVIVINDGSTDGTLEIVSKIPDRRIKVLSHPNAGAQKSRNRGIECALGEYLAFLDADDLWTRDKLECQLKALQANPEAAVAYSWTDFINESGERLGRGQHFQFSNNVYERLLLGDFIGSGSNPLVRKEAVLNVGNFDESLVGGQDWEMWLRLAARYHFTVVPKVQVLYRKSATSWSSNLKRQEIGYRQVIEKNLTVAPENIQRLRGKILANRYKFLTFDALQEELDRPGCLLAARFLAEALRHEPRLIGNRVIWIVTLKIFLGILLPSEKVQALLVNLKRFRKSHKTENTPE